jgi:hypothetical protein
VNGCIDPRFLTSALVGDEWSASSLGRFTLRDGTTRYPFNIWWASELFWTLWSKVKYISRGGIGTLALQPLALRYTDWAIPVSPSIVMSEKNFQALNNHVLFQF